MANYPITPSFICKICLLCLLALITELRERKFGYHICYAISSTLENYKREMIKQDGFEEFLDIIIIILNFSSSASCQGQGISFYPKYFCQDVWFECTHLLLISVLIMSQLRDLSSLYNKIAFLPIHKKKQKEHGYKYSFQMGIYFEEKNYKCNNYLKCIQFSTVMFRPRETWPLLV